MRLVLIRHAQSGHGAHRIAELSGCSGLTEHGHTQARRLADRLRRTGELADCRAFLCSPVLRARQTGDALQSVFPKLPMELNYNLCELHPGAADGLTWEEYVAQYGRFDPVTEPTRPFAPGGETWIEFLARVRATLEGLADRHAGQTIVAVSHAAFIVASFLALFDIPRPGTRARIDPQYTSLTTWDTLEGVWRLTQYNDTAHLA